MVALGGELRKIHLLESPLVDGFITSYPVDGDNVITRKIAKTSPGFEPTVTARSETTKQSAVENENNSNVTAGSETTKQSAVGKVWINDTQYFDNVPEVAWKFYIGGYQPAQKWLKDRKKRKLSFEDILHYQKIIVALTQTDKLMKEIDKIEIIKED